jgi:hypothetical protein
MTWTWTVNDKTVTGIKQIGEHIIKMQARNIREDKFSRKSATVSIYFNTLLLEAGKFGTSTSGTQQLPRPRGQHLREYLGYFNRSVFNRQVLFFLHHHQAVNLL